LVWDEALHLVLEATSTCSLVQVLQKAYNKGMQARVLQREGIRGRRNLLSKEKARLPLYSHGGQVTCRDGRFFRPEWLRALSEGEASELGQC
jgi:hypothetical protein